MIFLAGSSITGVLSLTPTTLESLRINAMPPLLLLLLRTSCEEYVK